MKKNLTFSGERRNRLAKAKPFGWYLLGVGLAGIVGGVTGDGKNVILVAAVGLLFRLWEGIPTMNPIWWGAEFLTGGMAVTLFEELASSGEEMLQTIEGGVFLFLLVGFCFFSKRFFLSALTLFLLMLLSLSGAGNPATIGAVMMGALCGFFPLREEMKNITFI